MFKTSRDSILYFANQPAGYIAVRKFLKKDVQSVLDKMERQGFIKKEYENLSEICYKATRHGKAEFITLQIKRRLALGWDVSKLEAELSLLSTDRVN